MFYINNALQPVKDLGKYCQIKEYLGLPKNIIVKANDRLQNINLVKWSRTTEKYWVELRDFKEASEEKL